MITQIDFKTLAAKKNSGVIGRIFIAYSLEINEPTSIVAPKNVMLFGQNIKMVGKTWIFLSPITRCSERISEIIEKPQKQTP